MELEWNDPTEVAPEAGHGASVPGHPACSRAPRGTLPDRNLCRRPVGRGRSSRSAWLRHERRDRPVGVARAPADRRLTWSSDLYLATEPDRVRGAALVV